MLYLKEANDIDFEEEFEYISNLPPDENGFTNNDYGCTKAEFKRILLTYIEHSKGINLAEGRVPVTHYFLWKDDTVIGLFRIRHRLNDFLTEGPGHISFGIKKEYRGNGFSNEGLKLAIQKAWSIIPEDEIYMCVDKSNTASLKAQLKNGAYIHHENDEEYFTRIKRH